MTEAQVAEVQAAHEAVERAWGAFRTARIGEHWDVDAKYDAYVNAIDGSNGVCLRVWEECRVANSS
jgi:hypothetical protein